MLIIKHSVDKKNSLCLNKRQILTRYATNPLHYLKHLMLITTNYPQLQDWQGKWNTVVVFITIQQIDKMGLLLPSCNKAFSFPAAGNYFKEISVHVKCSREGYSVTSCVFSPLRGLQSMLSKEGKRDAGVVTGRQEY